MAKARITGVLKINEYKYMVVSNCNIFPPDRWGYGTSGGDVDLIYASDELDAWKKGKAVADEWNEGNKTKRQAVRGKAKTD